jgi:hypothetical protein
VPVKITVATTNAQAAARREYGRLIAIRLLVLVVD